MSYNFKDKSIGEVNMDMNQNLGNLMKEAQKMQQRMQEAQEKLSKLIITGEAGGGLVKIKINGRHAFLEVKIAPRLMEDDVEMLEDLIVAAANDAVQKVEAASKTEISRLTAGLNIPTDFLKKEEDK
jgi:DNA-binding YbaB/EbfC family protein